MDIIKQIADAVFKILHILDMYSFKAGFTQLIINAILGFFNA